MGRGGGGRLLPASPGIGSAPAAPAQAWQPRTSRKRGAWGCADRLPHPRSGQPTALVEIASSKLVLSAVFFFVSLLSLGDGRERESETENLLDANPWVLLSFHKGVGEGGQSCG